MKTKILVAALFIGISIIPLACSEKEPEVKPVARGGQININLNHKVNGKTAEFDEYLYMNEAGDSFQVTLLQYYFSNVEFHSPETGWKKQDIYRLVQLQNPATLNFEFPNLAFGEYDSIRFYVGIDSAANHDIDKLDDLDPDKGMIWTWNSGYIFYMFEGKFINDNNLAVPFAYHIGGDNYLMKYELPIQSKKTLSVSSTTATIDLEMELDQIFRSPNLIELNKVASVSHTFDEPVLSTQMKDNLLDAFTAK